MIDRRRMLLGITAAAVTGWSTIRPSRADELEDKRLANRLELWSNYAKRTKNLVVRLTTTRETSLLREPLIVTGTLVFEQPGTLVLRDDGLAGSTTFFDAQGMRIRPNRPDAAPTIIDRNRVPAAGWLGDRLRGTFAPGEGTELVADSRAEVPRGGQRLELLPLRDSAARRLVRSMTLHFDVVSGAVIEILIAEAQGDRVRMQLADHRQNVPDEDIRALLGEP